MVFIDSFLLALLSLVFVLLPPYRKTSLVFILFAMQFAVLGCLNTRVFYDPYIDLGNQVLLLVLCLGIYLYAAFSVQKSRWLFLVPAVLFVVTFIMGYLEIHRLVITGTAVFSGLWQVYVLARPDLVQQLDTMSKRFYLLMVLTIFFDAVLQAFLQLNT